MEPIDYWRLCDELSIIQASALLIEQDPADFEDQVENWSSNNKPVGYEAAKNAISKALLRKQIEGTLVPILEYDRDGDVCGELENTVNVQQSTVLVSSLRDWLANRGFTKGFFFQGKTPAPTYLDPSHPRYAPKLAAAIRAWEAVDSAALLSGKTPKQALMKWLRENATSFHLTDTEGRPVDQSIEEIAKVANWQPLGGAPKTPSG
jgi:hypothetical protein